MFYCRLAASEYSFCGRVAVVELSFSIIGQVCEIVSHVRLLPIVPLLLAGYVDLFHVFDVFVHYVISFIKSFI